MRRRLPGGIVPSATGYLGELDVTPSLTCGDQQIAGPTRRGASGARASDVWVRRRRWSTVIDRSSGIWACRRRSPRRRRLARRGVLRDSLSFVATGDPVEHTIDVQIG